MRDSILPLPAPPRPDPPAHTLRASINGAIAAGRWANVFWVRNGGGSTPSDGDLEEFAQAFYGYWSLRFLPFCNSQVIQEGCVVNYYGGSGFQIGSQWVTNSTGTLSGAPISAQVSTGISWHVQQRYRGGHPRTYLPPGDSSLLQTATRWTDAHVEAVRLAANAFLLDVNGNTFPNLFDLHLGTVSFVLRNEWRDPPVFRDFSPAATLVDHRPDTQRRRLGPDL